MARNQYMQAMNALAAYGQAPGGFTGLAHQGPFARWLRGEQNTQMPGPQQELRTRFNESATRPSPHALNIEGGLAITRSIIESLIRALIETTPETAHDVSIILQNQLASMDESLERLREVQREADDWAGVSRQHRNDFNQALYRLHLIPSDEVTAKVNQDVTSDQAPRNNGAWRENADKYPPSMICSIVLEPFRDPVQAEDGHSYERAAITRWINSGNRTSPKTGAVMGSSLRANHGLRSSVEEFTAMLTKKDNSN